MIPEARARQQADRLLEQVGWPVCDFRAADLQAASGIATREIQILDGCGTAETRRYGEGEAPLGDHSSREAEGRADGLRRQLRRGIACEWCSRSLDELVKYAPGERGHGVRLSEQLFTVSVKTAPA
jgi:hypothetical protein